MVTLKNPAFGISVAIVTNTVSRLTFGGQTNQARGPEWFKARIFDWRFDNLTKEMLDGFLAYAIANAGQYVTITDEQNVERSGIIDSIIKFRQTHDRPCPLYEMSFTFVGATE